MADGFGPLEWKYGGERRMGDAFSQNGISLPDLIHTEWLITWHTSDALSSLPWFADAEQVVG